MALELLIFIGLFALALGMIGSYLGGTDSEKRKLRAEHEARRLAMLRWDREQHGVLRSPVRQLTPTRPI
jgi:hypothetical protein